VHLIPKLEKSVETASALNDTMASVYRHGRTTHGHPSEPSTRFRDPNLFLRVALLFASATVVAWRWMLLMLPILALGAAIAFFGNDHQTFRIRMKRLPNDPIGDVRTVQWQVSRCANRPTKESRFPGIWKMTGAVSEEVEPGRESLPCRSHVATSRRRLARQSDGHAGDATHRDQCLA